MESKEYAGYWKSKGNVGLNGRFVFGTIGCYLPSDFSVVGTKVLRVPVQVEYFGTYNKGKVLDFDVKCSRIPNTDQVEMKGNFPSGTTITYVVTSMNGGDLKGTYESRNPKDKGVYYIAPGSVETLTRPKHALLKSIFSSK